MIKRETCLGCKKKLNGWQYKYCSNRCQRRLGYLIFIKKWKKESVNGSYAVSTKNISSHIKRYFLEKYGCKCMLCGWGEKHPLTGRVPLEIDHIDGNSSNNNMRNLRLICPNCHSLSFSYRNLNKGHGRLWRRDKYLKISLENEGV